MVDLGYCLILVSNLKFDYNSPACPFIRAQTLVRACVGAPVSNGADGRMMVVVIGLVNGSLCLPMSVMNAFGMSRIYAIRFGLWSASAAGRSNTSVHDGEHIQIFTFCRLSYFVMFTFSKHTCLISHPSH